MKFLSLLLSLLITTTAQAQDTLRMAVTTSFNNSGLADVLLPEIDRALDIEVHLLVVGTGQALKLGRAGDVDAILVHSRSAEEAFVAEGFAPYRREVMYNDFVFVGPENDPVNVSNAVSAADALRRIEGFDFISRGDDSGTHRKEMALWQEAGLTPQGDWYKPVGAGMGAALNTASGLGAYVLADRASWLNFKRKAGMVLLYAGDPSLFNQYTFLPVSADRHPHAKRDLALRLEEWLTGPAVEALIDGHTIDGQRLFTFNAGPQTH